MFIKVLTLSNLLIITSALNINVKNNCKWTIDVYSHETNKFNNVCKIQSNKSCLLKLGNNEIHSGLIKNLDGESATLFEFTQAKDGIYYDISVIPPGSGVCYSYDECLKKSGGKTSYNDALKV